MNITDNPYFKVVAAKPIEVCQKNADEILSGDSWSAYLRNNNYDLEYLSGELAGRAKKIAITGEEFEGLENGSLTVDDILIAHNAN